MKRDAKNLAMSGKRIGAILSLLFVVLIVAALIHGGEEPLHPIEQAVEMPENVR
ncbi:hypothetical protein [Erythrobacter sp.]|uniref:hypothetical protein n=1 Tax=Erythrobacter sp. TaxID=1042 RepID=UPI001B1732FC|nr:hypothetical protein [Erythrobacter sp.]MBO6526911.1 hypothetical protein [Erythrobacter sp.]MBO6528583.1 hypothetical protein [Erythrobacter sp.]